MAETDRIQRCSGSAETRRSINKQEVDSVGEHGKCVSVGFIPQFGGRYGMCSAMQACPRRNASGQIEG